MMTRPPCPWVCVLSLALSALPLSAQSTFLDCDPSALNSALQFDGVNDFVRVPYSSAFPTESFTVSMWVKAGQQSEDFASIVSRGEDAVTDNVPWSMCLLEDGRFDVEIEKADDGSAHYASQSIVANDAWHHVAVTRDASGTLVFYIDGVADASHRHTYTPSLFSQQDLSIGCEIGTFSVPPPHKPSRFFRGTVGEVGLWNLPLPPTSIAALYQSGITTSDPGLVAYWSLDEGLSQDVPDDTGGGHDGVLGTDSGTGTDDPVRLIAFACPLSAVEGDLSVSSGGTQYFSIGPGSDYALMLYFLAGSATGTSPGFSVGSLAIPLNPDAFFFYTVNHPNVDPYKKTLGFLSGAGKGSARITIPPGSAPSLIGIQLHHAYLVWDVLGGAGAVFASNAVPVTFVP